MKETQPHILSEEEIKKCLFSTSQGDQPAFTLLLRFFWNKVYTQAITYLKSAEQAQEITQDVFIKIWEGRNRLAEIENFSDYLFIISRNQVISALRKKGENLLAVPDELEEPLLRPDSQLHYKESYNKILHLIEQLPPTRKKVFTMSRLDGKSYDEIGAMLSISRNGVKDHIVKALNYLRSRLKETDEKPLIIILGALLLFRCFF